MQQKKNTNPKTKLRSSLRQTIAVAATITVIGGSMATGIAASIPVVSTVIDGEQVYTVRTNRVDTKTLLDIADVECSEGDIIERTENDSVTLVVKRAMQVPCDRGWGNHGDTGSHRRYGTGLSRSCKKQALPWMGTISSTCRRISRCKRGRISRSPGCIRCM